MLQIKAMTWKERKKVKKIRFKSNQNKVYLKIISAIIEKFFSSSFNLIILDLGVLTFKGRTIVTVSKVAVGANIIVILVGLISAWRFSINPNNRFVLVDSNGSNHLIKKIGRFFWQDILLITNLNKSLMKTMDYQNQLPEATKKQNCFE